MVTLHNIERKSGNTTELGGRIWTGQVWLNWFLQEIIPFCGSTCKLTFATTQIKLEFQVGPECDNIRFKILPNSIARLQANCLSLVEPQLNPSLFYDLL